MAEAIRQKLNKVVSKFRATEPDTWPKIFVASSEGKVDQLKELIKSDAKQVNAMFDDGTTPLYLAAQNGHAAAVQILLDNEASPNIGRNDGATPLLIASGKGHLEVVKKLLTSNIDVNLAKSSGSTPLYVAAQNGYLEIVTELVKAKADINKGKLNSTPCDIAKHQNHNNVVDYLLANGGKFYRT